MGRKGDGGAEKEMGVRQKMMRELLPELLPKKKVLLPRVMTFSRIPGAPKIILKSLGTLDSPHFFERSRFDLIDQI